MNKIKKGFNEIKADEKLKENTLNNVLECLEKKQNKKRTYGRLVLKSAAVICLIAVVFTATFKISEFPENKAYAAISIEGDTSIVITLNKNNDIISIDCYGDDKNIEDVRFDEFIGENYEKVWNEIADKLNIDNSEEYEVEINIACNNKENADNIEKYIEESGNYKCNGMNYKYMDEAKSKGLSIGKYKIYEELKSIYVDLQPEDIENISMNELRKILDGDMTFDEVQKQNGKSNEGKESNGLREQKRKGRSEQ